MPHIISENHRLAWRTLLEAQSSVTKELDRRLRQTNEVPLEVYDVLSTLEEADGHRLRMSELADTVMFSRSGLTRMVDRLEEQGLVRREPFPDDRRGWFAVVTPEGIAARHKACEIVQTALLECWENVVTDEEVRQIHSLMSRVAKEARAAAWA